MDNQQQRPNILLLTTDQQRYDTIAAMGYPYMITPNLDRLVREGCSFPLSHTPNPACIPARHNIITGQYSAVTGMDDNYFDSPRRMPEGLPTLAGILSDASYETTAVGKMHFLPARNHNGFGRMELMEEIPRYRQDDDYAMYLTSVGEERIQSLHGVRNVLAMLPQQPIQAEEHTGTCWVADRLIQHLQNNGGKRPFFYWGSWIAPHPPFSVPKRYADLYSSRDLPKSTPPDARPKPITLASSHLADYFDEKVARRARECYYGAITWVDEQIGRVLDALAEIGQLDKTLILFTSDHGELLGDHGSYQKFQPYEGSVHIPMVIRYPQRLKAGSKYSAFADLNDILPTVLDAAGLTYPGKLPLPGDSLLVPPAKSNKERSGQYVEHSNGKRRWISYRDERYKYVYYYAGGMEELFDLQTDPDEVTNLLEAGYAGEAYSRLKRSLLEAEQRWGPDGCVKGNHFRVMEQWTGVPALPATFPVFSKHLDNQEELLTLAEEISLAVQDEPSVVLSKLRWEEWIRAGYIDPQVRDTVLDGGCD